MSNIYNPRNNYHFLLLHGLFSCCSKLAQIKIWHLFSSIDLILVSLSTPQRHQVEWYELKATQAVTWSPWHLYKRPNLNIVFSFHTSTPNQSPLLSWTSLKAKPFVSSSYLLNALWLVEMVRRKTVLLFIAYEFGPKPLALLVVHTLNEAQ